MLDNKKRNRKIFHLIESTIHNLCKVLGTSYYSRDEAITVQYENKDLFYVYPEFNKVNFDININCMVFQDFSISKAAKLREIYKEDQITGFLKEAESSLWFLDDSRLVMSNLIKARYFEYSILKSKMLLEVYIGVQNARKLKDKLGDLLAKQEQISVN